MVTIDNIHKQITSLTGDLIGTGLCEAQNFPSRKSQAGKIDIIGVSNADYSIFLKNIPYYEMYKTLMETKNYNCKMIDGALISMSYIFQNNNLLKHRLSFFPAPNLDAFQNEPELYFEDEIYSEITDRRIVTIPLRFDYDNSEDVGKPVKHPISHLTLGQYTECRIPVTTALTPYQFLNFIVVNFYNTAQFRFNEELSIFKDCFASTISNEEKEHLHINTPKYRN